MHKIPHSRSLIIATSFTAAALLMLVFVRIAWGNDPDHAPDEDMKARIPFMPAQEVAANMATKTALLAAQDATVTAARAAIKGPKDISNTGVEVTVGPVPTGIDDSPTLYPGWSSVYHIENAWQEVVNGTRTTVYAGSRVDDQARGIWNTPEQGIVLVMVFPPGEDAKITSYEALAPIRSGRLHVIAAQDQLVTFASTTDNSQLVLDLNTHLWLNPSAGTKLGK